MNTFMSAQLAEQFVAKSGQDPHSLVADIAKLGAVRGIEKGDDEPDYRYTEKVLNAACVAHYIPGGEMFTMGDGSVESDSEWNSIPDDERDEVQEKVDEAIEDLYDKVMDEADAMHEDLTQLILNY